MYSLDDVKNTLDLLAKEPDGTMANKQTRDKAKKLLHQVAADFSTLAQKNPQTRAAKFLRETATLYRNIAIKTK